MRKFTKKQDEAEINMTPMLDIVFILLIFFIVTATFVKESGLDINQPDSDQPPPEEEEKQNILIRISNSNRICINLRTVDVRSLRPNIEQLRAQNPEAIVVIQPAPDAFAGLVTEAYDQALLAGATAIAIAEWNAGARC